MRACECVGMCVCVCVCVCVTLLSSWNASMTWSLLAPPPMSRKLAGDPPLSLMTSSVAMAKPAPLTKHPMLPSSPM